MEDIVELKLRKGDIYSFETLEESCIDESYGCLLRLRDIENDIICLAKKLHEGLCGDWASGDILLFYPDGETHSANKYDEFEFIGWIKIDE